MHFSVSSRLDSRLHSYLFIPNSLPLSFFSPSPPFSLFCFILFSKHSPFLSLIPALQSPSSISLSISSSSKSLLSTFSRLFFSFPISFLSSFCSSSLSITLFFLILPHYISLFIPLFSLYYSMFHLSTNPSLIYILVCPPSVLPYSFSLIHLHLFTISNYFPIHFPPSTPLFLILSSFFSLSSFHFLTTSLLFFSLLFLSPITPNSVFHISLLPTPPFSSSPPYLLSLLTLIFPSPTSPAHLQFSPDEFLSSSPPLLHFIFSHPLHILPSSISLSIPSPQILLNTQSSLLVNLSHLCAPCTTSSLPPPLLPQSFSFFPPLSPSHILSSLSLSISPSPRIEYLSPLSPSPTTSLLISFHPLPPQILLLFSPLPPSSHSIPLLFPSSSTPPPSSHPAHPQQSSSLPLPIPPQSSPL
ncbi:hypothetical protein C7M84_014928 [Penaeus vannamei]|uniref:Uncharacterized protein n=1 Tax=Penaeus vannamei TaxID=6689 RepID=A0A3R7SMC6_PENVA|nr:hypothetical protein C7M84_014928 [Penaeus vannamei]